MNKIIFLSIFISLSASAQNTQKEINKQVWRPFIENFNNRNTAGFMAVHSRDLIRSSRDSKTVLGWDEYYKQQEEGDKRSIASGRKHSIELHFTERIASEGKAIEVGIYKTSSVRDGQTRKSYGRFHVVMRKEKGVWKILLDTDSSEGETIGEKDFLAAKPMEE